VCTGRFLSFWGKLMPDKNAGLCFVVISGAKFWNGQGWVADWQDAIQFTCPPYRDPWLACNCLCQDIEASGVYCAPCFIPRPEVRPAKRPRLG